MNTAKAIKPAFPRLATVCATVALATCAAPARGVTVELDANADAGVFPVPGGTWDFGNTVLWTEDGGATRRAWTSNDDSILIELPDAASALGSLTVATDASNGAVGAAGLRIVGTFKDRNKVIFEGDGFSLGAQGIRNEINNANVYLYLLSPMTLTAPQIWKNSNLRAMNSLGTVVVSNRLTFAEGATLTLDGAGRADPANRGNDIPRCGFKVQVDQALSGPVCVSNGAVLSLAYSAASPGSKFASGASLSLSGGILQLNGKATTYEESLPSLHLGPGHSVLGGSNAKANLTIGGIVRERGATLDFPISWNGGVTGYFPGTANDAGVIIGGWATIATGSQFVKINDASTGALAGEDGTQRIPDSWTDGLNVQAHGGGTRTKGDVAIHSLQIRTDAAIDLGEATVTIRSGGLISLHANGTHLGGGTLRTGMDTGELFVHAAKPIEIGSALADNGDVPGWLVKGGSATLTLSGANGFSGGTYLNGGTLVVTNAASLQGEMHHAGGATLVVRDGGTLAVPDAGWTLDGNLAVGDGAVVRLPLRAASAGGVAPLTLANRWASLTLPGPGESATLALSFPDGVSPAKGTYPLIAWDAEADIAAADLSSLALSLPQGVSGELVSRAGGIDVAITTAAGGATMIIMR